MKLLNGLIFLSDFFLDMHYHCQEHESIKNVIGLIYLPERYKNQNEKDCVFSAYFCATVRRVHLELTVHRVILLYLYRNLTLRII